MSGGEARVRELTPRGRGGVSVLEISGPGVAERLAALGCSAPAPGRVRLARLDVGGELLDEALLVAASAERVELHVTGSPPLVRRLAVLLGADEADGADGAVRGSEPAIPIEDSALERLADAPCEAGARILLDQAEGALRRELTAGAGSSPGEWEALLDRLAARARIAEPALVPRRIALAGPVNAGKSTLFNLLVARERAVVSEEPGTTRDVVAAPARLGAWPVVLLDTAGDRAVPLDADVERAGQELGGRVRAGADLVLRLRPADGPSDPPTGDREVVLVSRADLAREPIDGGLPRVSSRDPAAARATVAAIFLARFDLPDDPWQAIGPGRAVPFGPSGAGLLEALRPLSEPGPRIRALERLLGHRSLADVEPARRVR